ncbi:MAG: hypothetical protein Q8O82_01960 [Pseudorhodobacter sp.]|nr:hypothetical protein [Pseudorhodobacter sp.]
MPLIGYDAATRLSKLALSKGITLRDAALAQGVDEALFEGLR